MFAYLTFDIGTTALKTAIISNDGRLLAAHTSEYTFDAPNPDWAEMSPQVYWNSAVEGTHAVFSLSGLNSKNLVGIGFSSQGQTFIPLNKSGNPLHNAIVWVDNRAQDVVDEWESTWMPRDDYRRISGYPWLPAGLTVFKIAWLKKHIPTAHKAWKFLCLPDYLIYRLTGETVTDRVIAQFSGLFNIVNKQWEPKLLQAADISANQLPDVLEPGTVAGRVHRDAASELGIPEGVPVCVGANDQIAGAVGAGNVSPGVVTETTGTSLALAATTDELLDDRRMLVGRHAAPDKYFVMPFTITSAIILKWLRDQTAPGEDYDSFLMGVDEIPPGCEGLTVLPHFAGTGSPTFNPNARGAFAGLTLRHTRTHMARAVMEACSCMLKECLDTVIEHNIGVNVIRSLGGAAKSDIWLQMKADMLGLKVERPSCPDAASVGAAILAAAGLGEFSSIEEAAGAWYKPAKLFEPDSNLFDSYREVYTCYKLLYEQLYG